MAQKLEKKTLNHADKTLFVELISLFEFHAALNIDHALESTTRIAHNKIQEIVRAHCLTIIQIDLV